jgi:hypothetical protein
MILVALLSSGLLAVLLHVAHLRHLPPPKDLLRLTPLGDNARLRWLIMLPQVGISVLRQHIEGKVTLEAGAILRCVNIV